MLIYIRYQDLYFIAWHVILFYARCCHFFSFYSSSCAICLLEFSSRATLEGSDASRAHAVSSIFLLFFIFPQQRVDTRNSFSIPNSQVAYSSSLTLFGLCMVDVGMVNSEHIDILMKNPFLFSPISFSPRLNSIRSRECKLAPSPLLLLVSFCERESMTFRRTSSISVPENFLLLMCNFFLLFFSSIRCFSYFSLPCL